MLWLHPSLTMACVQELEHEYVRVFYAAATDLPDVSFAVTQSNEVISKYGLTHDVVLLLKKVLYTQSTLDTLTRR